jgi:hypothetical protein
MQKCIYLPPQAPSGSQLMKITALLQDRPLKRRFVYRINALLHFALFEASQLSQTLMMEGDEGVNGV